MGITAFGGINIFKVNKAPYRDQTGGLYTAELNYNVTKGFFRSLLLNVGFECQIDNETFFYKPNDPFFHEENFHYRVRKNQVYFSVGIVF
jgi:hypothetical protein